VPKTPGAYFIISKLFEILKFLKKALKRTQTLKKQGKTPTFFIF
jgi:hypothetical protein